MHSIPRRLRIFLAFVGLACSFLVLFGTAFYLESGRDWNSKKHAELASMIQDIQSLPEAQQYFGDIRMVEPDGSISHNEGVFEFLPETIVRDSPAESFHGMTFYIIGTTLPGGETLLFADDITDAVELRRRILHSIQTSSLILMTLVIGIGWVFTYKIFRPVQAIVQSIEGFRLENPSKMDAVPVFGAENDEFVRIARKLEELFGRFRTEARKIEDLSSNIAHELKNGLFEVASTLDVAEVDASPLPHVQTAKKQVLHLGELVQSLLLLANKEREIVKQRVKLCSLIEKSIPLQETRVRVECAPKIQWNIVPDLFEIVLRNAIGNACKFTSETGTITIRASENTLSIADNGVGIPEKDIPFVWDRFYK